MTSPRTDRYIARMSRLRQMSAAEERAAIEAYRAGDKAAGQRLVESALKYAVRIVYRTNVKSDESIDEMIQAASLGLVQALNRFDPAKGRWTTYADNWCRVRIADWLHRDRTIQVPCDNASRIAMSDHRKGVVDTDRIATVGATSPERAKDLAEAATVRMLSAEMRVGGDKHNNIRPTLGDTLPASDAHTDVLLARAIADAVDGLTGAQRSYVLDVLLGTVRPLEWAKRRGVSRQAASAIGTRAIGSLRKALARQWADYAGVPMVGEEAA